MNERDRKRPQSVEPEVTYIRRRRPQPGARIGDSRESAVQMGDVERPERPER